MNAIGGAIVEVRHTLARGLTTRARLFEEVGDVEQELAIRWELIARYRNDEHLQLPVAISLSEAARILRARGDRRGAGRDAGAVFSCRRRVAWTPLVLSPQAAGVSWSW